MSSRQFRVACVVGVMGEGGGGGQRRRAKMKGIGGVHREHIENTNRLAVSEIEAGRGIIRKYQPWWEDEFSLFLAR